MLDVHPPHAPTHTWCDFFIHIGTIVVGLLIAVGLEQAVEALHHARQRQELREALRGDTEINNQWADQDITELNRFRLWANEQLAAVDKAGPSAELKLNRLPFKLIYTPNIGVWRAAKQNGEVSLLTVSEQTWFTDMDQEESDVFEDPTGSYKQFYRDRNSIERLLIERTTMQGSGELALSSMTAAQRLELEDCLRSLIQTIVTFENDLIEYSTYTEYLIRTPRDKLDTSASITDFATIESRKYASHPELKSIINSN